MRIVVCFIERTDTHEWFFYEFTTRTEHDYANLCSYQMPYFRHDWTNDPLKAIRLNTKEDAKSYAKNHYAELRNVEWIITEHEFVFD